VDDHGSARRTEDPTAATDRALAAALTADGSDGLVTIDELARRTGVSSVVLDAIVREGMLTPATSERPPRFHAADAEAVASGLELLRTGVPLDELLDLARRFDDAISGVADHAVEVFARFVRDPAAGTSTSPQEAAERVLAAFEAMLPAASELAAHRFRALLLTRARARLDGSD
jgi:DNA-binding transcriptional MerR regulator